MSAESNLAYLKSTYEEADRKLRIRFLKVGCYLVPGLTLMGAGLDHQVYPDKAWPLFEIRAGCILLTLGVLGLCYLKGIERHAKWLGIVWALITQASVTLMIYFTEGAASPYYAGLNLATVGIAVLLPWTLSEITLVCVVTLAMYVAACLCYKPPDGVFQTNAFFLNVNFLVFTDVICATCCGFATGKRFEDFQLRHELDCRNRDLTELGRLKMEFFSNVSHELRTPLTLIVSPLDAIFRSMDLSAEMRELLVPVRQNSLRLLKLINDLLELVRLEDARTQMQKEPVDLTAVLPGLIDSVRHLAMNKGLKVFAQPNEASLRVAADPSRLEKIILNVLMNAIKFTDSGGTITTRWRREGALAAIEIEDTGIGIAEKDLQLIFERFRQADSSATRRYQGTGIGLALAQELVVEHGGTMDVRSTIGKGSTFTINLPLATAEDKGSGVRDQGSGVKALAPGSNGANGSNGAVQPKVVPHSADDPIADIHRRANLTLVHTAQHVEPVVSGQGEATVLVVDDEQDMRKFVSGILAREHRVIQAADGISGLEAAKKYRPDLAILDLMLPGMDGLALCSKLREDPECKDMRIVLLTARSDESAKISALERGADDFMVKPFSTVELKTRVANLLKSAKLEKDVRTQNVQLMNAMKQLTDTLEQLKSVQAQLIQSEKMNALGGLAAGLLHEINNPLNFTLMALQVAQEGIPKNSEPLRDAMNDIEEGMNRIRDIILELRAFAVPSAADAVERFELMQASNLALRMVSHELNDIKLERELPHSVHASKTLFVQVLVNLILNAAYALQEVQGRERLIKVSSQKRGNRIMVRVRDNGTGIAPDVVPRIFEPFFTTRPVGKGTGLGLSVCHTIVKKHGGEINVRTELGQWTELEFDLPAAE